MTAKRCLKYNHPLSQFLSVNLQRVKNGFCITKKRHTA